MDVFTRAELERVTERGSYPGINQEEWRALREYLRRHVKFTPFPTEPVGWLIEQAGAELFCFSSDYPHPEGGRDPLGRFEASLEGVDESAKARFVINWRSAAIGF